MQSKQTIVTIDENGITLNTGLTSRQFANAKMGQYVTEPGLIVKKIGDNAFTTEEFRFTDTKTVPHEKLDNVILTNYENQGKTLFSILEQEKQQKTLQTLEDLNTIIEWSFENTIYIPNCGPIGTIVIPDGFLFLPFELFERSLLAQDKMLSFEYYGSWINTALNDIDAWRFTLSIYMYRSISGQKPFNAIDFEKRAEDYFDNNFIPLHLLVKIEEKIAHPINHNLSLTRVAHTSIKPHVKKTRTSTLTSRILEANTRADAISQVIPNGVNLKSIQQADTATLQAQENFKKKKAKELSKKRFLRKNKTVISVCTVIGIFVIAVGASIVQSSLAKPTTEGLTELEVVQTLYSAINTLDSALLESTGASKAIGNYSNMVSTLYVSEKMREAYEQTAPFLPPAQWVGTDSPAELFMFGLTNVTIKQTSQNIILPKKGDTATFAVSFYTVMRQGIDYFEVTESTDILSLTYGKKYWQIDSLENHTSQVPVDISTFIEDISITRTLIKEDSSIQIQDQGIILVEALREIYPWLPTAQEVEASVELIPAYLLSE